MDLHNFRTAQFSYKSDDLSERIKASNITEDAADLTALMALLVTIEAENPGTAHYLLRQLALINHHAHMSSRLKGDDNTWSIKAQGEIMDILEYLRTQDVEP